MRRSANDNFALTPAGSRHTRNGQGTSSPDREEQGNGLAVVPWHPGLRSDGGASTYAPWTSFEERVRTGPFGLSRFPSQPHSPLRIFILDTDGTGAGAVDPALWQFVRNHSPPRIRGEWHLGPVPEPEDPGLTEEEFNKAMKKLRRHVHNPTYPRRRAWRRGLFSRWNDVGNQRADDADGEEGKDECKVCAICLEAFGANGQVMMTPCNHMFHHDCIVPWVKSRGQCPVCRLELCERVQRRRRRENTALVAPRSISSNNHYGGVTGPADGALLDDELFFLIRAMEEAFNWINPSR